jgi:hypothetical protein
MSKQFTLSGVPTSARKMADRHAWEREKTDADPEESGQDDGVVGTRKTTPP